MGYLGAVSRSGAWIAALLTWTCLAGPVPAAVPVYVFPGYAWAGTPPPEPTTAFAFYALVGLPGAEAVLDEADPTAYGPLDAEGYPTQLLHKERRLERLGEDVLGSIRIRLYGAVEKGKAICYGFAVAPAEEAEWLFGTLQVCRDVHDHAPGSRAELAWELLVRVGAEAGDRPVESEEEAEALTQALRGFAAKVLAPLGLNDALVPHRDLVTEVRAALWVLVNDRTWTDPTRMLMELEPGDGRPSIREILAEAVRKQYRAVAALEARDQELKESVLVPGTNFLKPPDGGFRGKPHEQFFRRSEERRAREVLLETFRSWWEGQGLPKGGLTAPTPKLALGGGKDGAVPALLFGAVDDPGP